MTAVESCPNCGKSQKKATMVCDWCDTMFDHVIVPPPGLWPIILWWGFLALLALSGIFGLLWLLGWL